jgi:hypothetical protein
MMRFCLTFPNSSLRAILRHRLVHAKTALCRLYCPGATGFPGRMATEPIAVVRGVPEALERRVEVSVRLVTRPVPGIRPEVVILVIIVIVAVLAAWSVGHEPVTAISLIAGLAGVQVAPALLRRGAAALPPGGPGLSSPKP